MYATAARTDRLHGDEDFRSYTRAELAQIERRTKELTAERLADPVWWNDCLEGVNPVSTEVAAQLARCMRNLDLACKGEPIAVNALTSSLAILQRLARRRAEEDAHQQAERELDGGEL